MGERKDAAAWVLNTARGLTSLVAQHLMLAGASIESLSQPPTKHKIPLSRCECVTLGVTESALAADKRARASR
jgi:hypothetical protein